MNKLRCLVTGATGAVGPSVVAALVRAGHDVSVLVRSTPAKGLFPAGVQELQGDITSKQDVEQAVAGRQAVVHLAALLHDNNPSEQRQAEMRRVNTEAVAALVGLATQAGVGRFVFISTIAVYGYRPGTVCSEGTLPQPSTIYGQTKRDAEKLVLAACNQEGEPISTVLRLAAVYGPRVKGNYQTLLSALSRGRFLPIGSGTNRRTLVHTDDVARAVCVVLSEPGAVGQIYNVTDGAYHELHSIIEEMCAALGRRSPPVQIPVSVVRVAGRLLDGALKLTGRPARVAPLLDKYLEEVLVDGSALRQIGYEPQYDLRAGWEQTVQQLRAEGKLL